MKNGEDEERFKLSHTADMGEFTNDLPIIGAMTGGRERCSSSQGADVRQWSANRGDRGMSRQEQAKPSATRRCFASTISTRRSRMPQRHWRTLMALLM
jgi:hypothetical protein